MTASRGIYRAPGGSGDAVADTSNTSVTAVNAAADALASKNAAHASEVAAATSETNAASSASTATSQASSASSSATSAANSASSAAASSVSATSAKNAAQTSETNAASSATAAATSATNSASSATASSGSASTASTKASEAATSAFNSAVSANSASTSASTATTQASLATTKASDANTSANDAATSATASANSASASATSATNSSNSASTSTTQAGIATTKAGEAYTSAANAASSETNAANSASAASTSATNASSSATSALNSANAAAASYDAFDDRMLGAKTSDPTTDNDGNGLLVGALYFNSSSNEMKVYNGTSWQTAYVSLSGALLGLNNLSDLASASTSRTNLGLGTLATQNANSAAITGGSISGLSSLSTSGNATIDGDLLVTGTTTTVNTQVIAVEDNLIYLNEGSIVSNPDLGIAGNYNDGTYRHTGFFRDATDGRWKIFHQYTLDPDASPYIDTSHSSFALADMQANMFYGNLTGNVTGTVTNGVVTSGSYSNPSWLTALDFSKVLPSVSGNANKYLSNDGNALVWNNLSITPAGVSDQSNSSTGFFAFPVGTTAQRPSSPQNGYTRLNTTLGALESYYNGYWDIITWFKTPAAPTIGTATTTGSTTASVSFTAPTDIGGVGSIISSYTAVASPGGATGTVNQSGSGSITVTGLTTNTAYTFTVYATNQAGNSSSSSASNSITTWALPGTPTIGTATPTGTTSATVSFTAPASNGGTAITSYTAVASPGGATGTISQAGSGTITVNGLSQNTSYTFTVYATNAVGNGSASAASNSALTWNTPDAPTVGTATATSPSTATVAFTAPAYNGGTAITSYTAVSTPGNITGTISQAGSGTITVSGLTFNTAYTFKVYATNSVGAGAQSASSNSITTPMPAPVNNPLSVGTVYSSWATTNYMYGSYTGPAPIKSFDWRNTVSNIYWSSSGFHYSSDNATWNTGFDSPQPGNGGYSNAVYTGTVSSINYTTLYIRVYAGQPDRSQSSANSLLAVTQARFT